MNWLRNNRWLLILTLAALTIGVYWPVGTFEFVGFDDNIYVSGNPQVQRGIDIQGLKWAFTTFDVSNWHPLTWVSHMLDCQWFALNSGPHHLTNLWIHTINVLLLFWLIHQLTNSIWPPFCIAAIFAIHPLNVESVAWIAERKNVLSTLFGLLAIMAYRHFGLSASRKAYALAFGFLALSLMAKPMLVTLPFVLLLLDYWPLSRWVGHQDLPPQPVKELGTKPTEMNRRSKRKKEHSHSGRSREGDTPKAADDTRPAPRTLAQLILEKLPLLALSLISCIITVKAQHQAGSGLRSLEAFPLATRLGNAVFAYGLYLFKFIWPVNLAVFYPYPATQLPGWQILIASLLLGGISLLAWFYVTDKPFVIVGWLWYLGTLVPVIGLVQVGDQAMADRYAYVPMIGILLATVCCASSLILNSKTPQAVWVFPYILLITLLAFTTRRQLTAWENSIHLWQHTLLVTNQNYVAHAGLGRALAEQGKLTEAAEQLTRALELKPNYAHAKKNLAAVENNRGNVYYRTKQWEEAAACYERALKLNPNASDFHFNLGMALAAQDRNPEAMAELNKALSIQPDYVIARRSLADLLLKTGNYLEAIPHFQWLTQTHPEFETYLHLGNALGRAGRLEEAINALHSALDLNPNSLEAEQSIRELQESRSRSQKK
ncbi:MAG: tetratricopeptide repeat protein [Terriglobia bacterium]